MGLPCGKQLVDANYQSSNCDRFLGKVGNNPEQTVNENEGMCVALHNYFEP
ncbi:MAG: hypothetical protein AAFO76_08130 [Cyanobacteria bacterium J06607_15]